MEHRFVRAIVWSLLACAAVCVVTAGEIEERIFKEGAHWQGEDYVRARDTLTAHGERLLPLVKSKLRSEDWGERMFARILKLRIEHPEQLDGWRTAVLKALTSRARKALEKDPVDPKMLPAQGAGVPAAFLVDFLWEHHSRGSPGERERQAIGLQFAVSPSVEMAEAMLETAGEQHRLHGPVRHGLVKLGKEALPLARRAVGAPALSFPPAKSSSLTQKEKEARRQYWLASRKATVAVDVIWTTGDVDSIPLLVQQLGKGSYGRDEVYSHHQHYVEALAHALWRMNALEGLEPMLDQAFAAAGKRRGQRRRGREKQLYNGLRRYIVGFGKDALPTLKRRLKATEDGMDRMLLESLIAELSGAPGKTLEVASLRESLWFEPTAEGLVRLHQLTGEDVFERLAELTKARRRDVQAAAYLAMGELRDVRAVPLLVARVKNAHTDLERELARHRGPGAAPFDPRTAREAAYTFDSKLGGILSRGDLALLVLRRIGGEEARRALEELSAFSEYEVRAGTCLLLLAGDIQGVAKRLEDEDRAVREEAALALAEAGDPRGISELVRAASRRRGPAHEEWKARVVASRQDVRPVLRKLLETQEVCERVLAETLLLETEQPEKVKTYREALRDAARSVGMMHRIRVGMLESAAKRLVQREAFDESHIPLLEASCMFGHGIFSRGIAAFALAEFRKPRSMAVLAKSFDMGSLGVSNPAALALARFGEEGAKLAAKAPPPIPGEFDTGMQMTRHRGGVRVLAETQDIRGPVEIIKGLKALEQDKTIDDWDLRMSVYLDAAGKYNDRQLVDPMLHILDIKDVPERYHHIKAVELLSAYDDERLVPRFVRCLAKGNEGAVRTAAVTAITRRLGDGTAEFLIEQLHTVEDEGIRGRVLVALGELSYAERPAYPGKAKWSREKLRTNEARKVAAFRCRTLAYPVLVAALEDGSPELSEMAAQGLTILASGAMHGEKPDPRAVKPLTEWCRRRQRCFNPLANYLAKHGDEEAGRVLLEILRSRPADAKDMGIVSALAKLRPDGAVPVLLRNLRARYAGKKSYYGSPAEVKALAQYGEAGAQAILTFFTEFDHMLYRIACAGHLADLEHKPAADPVAAYLLEVIEAGPENPKLVIGGGQGHMTREEVYLSRCRTLFRTLNRLDPGQAKAIARKVLLEGPATVTPAAVEVWGPEAG